MSGIFPTRGCFPPGLRPATLTTAREAPPIIEAKWLAANLQAMLEFLGGRASDRKLRLFNMACCRLLEPWLRGERARQVITEAGRARTPLGIECGPRARRTPHGRIGLPYGVAVAAGSRR